MLQNNNKECHYGLEGAIKRKYFRPRLDPLLPPKELWKNISDNGVYEDIIKR